MFIDLRQMPDGSEIDADLCVIGAGAAGITIARAFIGKHATVCLVESGGLQFEGDTQALYQGKLVGRSYFDLGATRLRYFGGSTNHWGGWCAPLHPVDFERREGVPFSGWPIGRNDLDAYYPPAHKMVQIGPPRYDAAFWQVDGWRAPAFQPDRMATQILQISDPATHFGQRYREELDKAGNVRVLLHANALAIDSNDTASLATSVRLATLDGKRARLRAKLIVVACGGLETPRVLLLSNSVIPAGLGNQHDLVGRFFMEHPHIVTGSLFVTDKGNWHLGFSQNLFKGGTHVRAAIATSGAALRHNRLLGYSATFETPVRGDAGYPAYRRIADALKAGSLPDNLGRDIWNVVTDLDDVARGRSESPPGKPYHLPYDLSRPIRLYTRLEQAPNPDSRVVLTVERDRLGLNRMALDWRLTALDKRSLRRSLKLVGAEFGRLGVARLQFDDWVLAEDDDWPADLHGGHHHMGTTRMSDDPTRGVVDRDCRVHGIDNLYVAGSAVFSTSGHVNPTLTIVALSLRLADHLKQRLGMG
jgi:choline dehydrogenase-like flavoprotein